MGGPMLMRGFGAKGMDVSSRYVLILGRELIVASRRRTTQERLQ